MSRIPLAAGDIVSSQVLLKRFRGKTAKEVYRCAKGIVVTKSLSGPALYTAVGQGGEAVVGYLSGFGLVRWMYCHFHRSISCRYLLKPSSKGFGGCYRYSSTNSKILILKNNK